MEKETFASGKRQKSKSNNGFFILKNSNKKNWVPADENRLQNVD